MFCASPPTTVTRRDLLTRWRLSCLDLKLLVGGFLPIVCTKARARRLSSWTVGRSTLASGGRHDLPKRSYLGR